MTAPARTTAIAAVLAWSGALVGWYGGLVAVLAVLLLGCCVAAMLRPPPAWVALIVVIPAAATSGAVAAGRHHATLAAEITAGRVEIGGVVADEPIERDGKRIFVLKAVVAADGTRLPPIAVEMVGPDLPAVGSRLRLTGTLRPNPTRIRGDPVAGVLTRVRVTAIELADNPMLRTGNAVRDRVDHVLAARRHRPELALVSGFLIGDISDLPAQDAERLRRAGLTHFVAVSGSNVALFLAAWWLVLVPLAGPRLRAVVGLVGLGIFLVVTRWEPSVVRASTMVGMVLVGRLVGIPIDPAVALGAAVTGLLLFSGDLAVNPGFQLSVAATAGVMVGIRWFKDRRPRWVWSALGATVAAQAAVLPLLLWHFGTVPLLAPVANLLAAPLVTVATALGGLAVLAGSTWIVDLSGFVAAAVLQVARVASGWPQLGPTEALLVLAVGAMALRRSARPLVVAGAVVSLLVGHAPAPAPDGAAVTFMSVGQGDATLIRDGRLVVLVDGGPDPVVLGNALRRHGVGTIDLLVATHGDGDHSGGLAGILDDRPVGRLWVPDYAELGPMLSELVADATERGIPVDRVRSGHRERLGSLRITALGPRRRYAADNDGSVVVFISVPGGRRVLLPGDIEATAQAELTGLDPDILLVPHHGAGTSDPRWLADTAAPLSVISVGPNRFGHPASEVIAVLERSGATVLTTREEGDITVPLRPP